jgi:uncharacterized membrane protein YfcA
MPRDRLLKLGVIATIAGAYSGMLGVGGGGVIMPLLIIWLGYSAHEATGTSMLAIIAIALMAAIGQGLYGNVDLADGALIAVPAVVGVVVGTSVQQHVPERAISFMFAALMIAIAIELVVG